MTEAEFIARLRALPLHPGARALLDDVATLAPGDDTLVLTTDTMVEQVHFPADMAPGEVAWRLVACALSDLAAKGAEPIGVMLNYCLRAERNSPSTYAPSPEGMEEGWDFAFLNGLADALNHFAAPILGGDTVSIPPEAPRVLTITAIGRATHTPVPIRSGARAGDLLYVTGVIGAALLGFEQPDSAPNVFRSPTPQIGEGIALAPQVSAMMDVSDGLLLDAQRMAAASGLAATIALDAVPVPPELSADRIRAVTWGDDYQLLFALPPGVAPAVAATRVGVFAGGSGLSLTEHGEAIVLPDRLGYQH